MINTVHTINASSAGTLTGLIKKFALSSLWINNAYKMPKN